MLFALCLIPLGGEIAQADAIKMDEYEAGDTDNVGAYGGICYAQTFIPTDTCMVSSIKLKLFKDWADSALNISVQIYNVTLLGVPDIDSPVSSAGYISSSTVTKTAPGSWYEFNLTGTVVNGYVYAIVLTNMGGDSSNVIQWRYDATGAYLSGRYWNSDDGGLNWGSNAGYDFMFQVYGEAVDLTDYEQNTSENATETVQTTDWAAQTFTTGTALHDIEYVQLRLQRTGSNPGDINVYIVSVSGTNAPVWIDETYALASGHISSSAVDNATEAWYYVPMSTEPSTLISYRPDYSTRYAIVVAVPDGGVADYVDWSCNDSDVYAGGSAFTSADSGVTWAAITSDFAFKITGNSTLRIVDVAVFTNYMETGDMLFLVHYEVWLDTRYPDSRLTFYLSTENSTGGAVGKTGLGGLDSNGWGYKPGCIYLNAATAAQIEWMGTCNVTIAPYAETCDNTTYLLAPSDWVGSDKNLLDYWVRQTAQVMDLYYDGYIDIYAETFNNQYGTATMLPGMGLLTEEGGDIFISGIYGLEEMRPHLFYMIKSKINTEFVKYTGAGKHELTNTVGPQFMTVFNSWGAVFNMSGVTFAAVLMMGLACGTAGIGMFVAQDVRGGIIGAVPIMIFSFAMGFWPLAVLSIISMIVVAVFSFRNVLRT